MTMFRDALKVILKHEGGYVNHPKDPGGETNLGVTKRVWQEWTGQKTVNMKALTPALVAPLYEARYWNAVKCGQLPPGLALCVFDFAVNAGVSRAGRYLQRLVGSPEDGIVGRMTLEKVQQFVAANGEPEAVRRYQQLRRNYYRALKTFPTFGRGWLRRVDETETDALRMAR
jgi:lysozyme family protein